MLPASLAALALIGSQPAVNDAPQVEPAPAQPTITQPVAAPPAATPDPQDSSAAGIAPSPPAPSQAPPPPQPGEIVVTGRGKPPPGDPLQAINAESFKVVQAVDGAIVAPIAYGYRSILPEPVKDGFHNALTNLTEPIVFVNDVLQLKIGRAVKTLGRFVINTTLGVGGLFDVAKRKPFKIPYHINGFAYTMGYWGIKPGPFLYVPLLGPTTVRDMIGRVVDLSLLPAIAGKPFNDPKYALASGALKSIDERLERDDLLTVIKEDCPDPYAAERTWYLVKRQAVIDGLHGRPTDVMSKLPQCLVDGLKTRAAARAKLLPDGSAPSVEGKDLSPRP